MAKKDAEVKVGADVSEVEQAAGKMREAFREASADLVGSIGGAAKSAITSLTSVATSAASINFHAQHEQVRAFEAETARMSVAFGKNLGDVRSGLMQTGMELGKRPQEIAAWVNSVGQLTYRFDDAAQSAKAFGELSAKTGRSLDDYRGLAMSLGQLGVKGKDVSGVLGTMVAQADALGNDGGIAAFADQVEAAGDAMTHFAARGGDGIKEMTGLLATLGKGLDNVTAKRVQQGALNALMSDPRGWERYVGHHIIDDKTGKINDPAKVFQEIYAKTARRYKDPETFRAVMLNNFGPELGTALMRAGKSGDFTKVADVAKLGPSNVLPEANKALLGTDAGKRMQAEAELAKSSMELFKSSSMLGKAADALQNFAAKNPVTSTVGAGVAGAIGAAGTGAVGKLVVGKIMGGAAGTEMAAGGAATLGVLGTGLAIAGSAGVGLYGGYKLGNYLSDKYEEKVGSKETAAELSAADQETARLKAIRDKKRAERGWAPISNGSQESAPAPGMGMNQKSIEDAVQRGASQARFTIINATGGPIGVANQSAQSGSAGNQG